MKNDLGRRNGFTLIEMLIVLSIIALLIAGVSISLPTQGKNARDSRRKVDIEQIRAALELYRTDKPNGNYPGATWQTDLTTGGYMNSVPVDPINVAPNVYTYAPLPAGCTTSGVPSYCTTYSITTQLERTGAPYTMYPQSVAN